MSVLSGTQTCVTAGECETWILTVSWLQMYLKKLESIKGASWSPAAASKALESELHLLWTESAGNGRLHCVKKVPEGRDYASTTS